jgi:DNA polymerase III delta subunit
MIIFLYGPDDYRRAQKKRDLIAEFQKKRSDLGMRSFDLLAKDWRDEFQEFSRSGSLFESARLAIFENAFELEPKMLKGIVEPFITDKSITILLSEHDKPLKAVSFLLEKPVISQKFENMEGAEWINFVASEAKKQGTKLTASAAQFLATVYQGNSWALATELQKLSGYKNGTPAQPGVIDKKDLDAFDLEAAPDYWMLLNGLKSFDIRARLGTLEKLFSMSDPPAKIFNIMAAQAGQKIPQFAEFDFAIKSGKLDYEEALVDLAIS